MLNWHTVYWIVLISFLSFTCRQKSLRRRGRFRRAVIKVTDVFALHRPRHSSKMRQSPALLTPCLYLFSALCPPVPPAFCPAFSSIVRLLCCDIIIHVLRRVLQKAAEDQATHWTEAMIQRVHIALFFFLYRIYLVWASLFMTQTTCSKKKNPSFTTQALHLIGQALLEEKTQLEDSTVEDVTFDFSLKARSEWKPIVLLFTPDPL